MPSLNDPFLEREEIARDLLSHDIDAVDLELHPDLTLLPQGFEATKDLQIPFPDGKAPVPTAPDEDADTTKPLPRADVLIFTWTVDEQDALADVLTPGYARKTWTRYDRKFDNYKSQIRPGAPAAKAERLGSWCLTQIADQKVICFKSELHLNQDGIKDFNGPGYASLPVAAMFRQVIGESKPSLVITTGTAGGVYDDDDLGDVAVTRGAKFRLQSEFKNAPFASEEYQSDWNPPTTYLGQAVDLMRNFAKNLSEPPLLGPTVKHKGEIKPRQYVPSVRFDWGEGHDEGDKIIGMKKFHPVLTTDYFEYGTSVNKLWEEGCAVEMGDAVLGMICTQANGPNWLVVRNASDPQINGDLEKDLQMAFAVHYYKKYGYWTSVNSALTVWSIIAGL
jgi:hypothetical protein